MTSISGLSAGMTLQLFQSAASRGRDVGVRVKGGRVSLAVGRTDWGAESSVGWGRVGMAVVGIAIVGVAAGPAEQAASKAVIHPRNKSVLLILLSACPLDGFRDPGGEHAFPFRREMNAAVRELL